MTLDESNHSASGLLKHLAAEVPRGEATRQTQCIPKLHLKVSAAEGRGLLACSLANKRFCMSYDMMTSNKNGQAWLITTFPQIVLDHDPGPHTDGVILGLDKKFCQEFHKGYMGVI